MAMFMLVASIMPFVLATDTGMDIGLDITPEAFEPLIWGCDSRVVYDDTIESGRSTLGGTPLLERMNNYAFEGEQIVWDVFVMDKNKIEQITDVVATIGDVQGTGNDIEVECYESTLPTTVPANCNARILEEDLTGTNTDSMTQAMYHCVLTVETDASMDGEYWVTVEAISEDASATMDENEYWYLNPTIALSIEGDLSFDEVRPGTISYSSTLLVGNDAADGSGVLLDMFMSGTDFYDSTDSGARCPTTNRLKLSHDLRQAASLGADIAAGTTSTTACNAGTGGLSNVDNNDHICYMATNGAYSTVGAANADAEGYRPIVYSNAFTRDFYNDAEIISNDQLVYNGITYDAGNVLTPGSEIAVTFKLALPEPCVGDFDTGSLYFWGEAI